MHNISRVLTQQSPFYEVNPETEFTELNGAEFEIPIASPLGDESEMEALEADEAELAAELLSVANDEEMEQFLGKVLSRALRGASHFAKSAAGRALGGALKSVAKTALPSVGAALGSMIPIPGVGTALGTMAGRAIAKHLEMEAPALAQEDLEFETAQRVVRVAKSAARNLATHPGLASNAQAALAQSMKSAVADLQRGARTAVNPKISGTRVRANSGRWFRRGNTIVIQGV
jgi:hypothetical protein